MTTDFDRMTHEEMLRWLDEAADGEVRSAADRLVGAVKEIRRIAEDLRVRPQRLEWRGEGAEAFRAWSADLANATLRLGDYGEGAAKWLTEASDAIASAQTSIPRPGTLPRHDAALATWNDPTAPAAARDSAHALLASAAEDRREAAAQMRRLAQTYELSASQLTALEKPVFPPLPDEAVPQERGTRGKGERRYVDAAGAGAGLPAADPPGPAAPHTAEPRTAVPHAAVPRTEGAGALPAGDRGTPLPGTDPPAPQVAMGIDGVASLPTPPPDSPTALASSPAASRPGAAPPSPPPPLSPSSPLSLLPPVGPAGHASAGARTHVPVVQAAAPARSGAALPGERGISGGRAVAHAPDRTAGALPRGTVVGAEGPDRSPVGPVAGAASLGGPQQPGRTAAGPVTPGGSGLVRRGGAGGGAPAGAPRSGGRRDRLAEDEETWRRPSRRLVPPVVG
ncbi:WXG100 family type VII secretion target [Streptomyces sp. NPDC058382]|uniref:WXG100 family type VII secretion target n=1 Tax=unclassified Streptomyces TaxID=2593676 RepID=UPI003637059C